jgi:hypothetical protein
MEHMNDAKTFLANIRLGWKGLPVTNTLAYYKHSKITVKKVFQHFA